MTVPDHNRRRIRTVKLAVLSIVLLPIAINDQP
jgi:hypothetical protein